MTNPRHGRRNPLTPGLRAVVVALSLAGSGAAIAADPLPTSPWSLSSMRVPQALARVATPLADVPVAVVDTGVDLRHTQLASRLWTSPAGLQRPDGLGEVPAGSAGWDFVGADATPSPERAAPGEPGAYFDHGTKVAGIVAAVRAPGASAAGVAPNARIMVIRSCTSGPLGCGGSLIGSGMAWAADAGARVVNVSVGGSSADPSESSAIASHPSTLFVVSAGNAGRDIDASGRGHWPCSEPASNVICVANTDEDDRLAESSNFGVTSVDVAAPGVAIPTTTVAGSGLGTGTSEASPQVAGVATMLFGAIPDATAAQVREAILTSTRRVSALNGKVASGGIVDAEAALLRLHALRGLPVPPCPAGSACEVRVSVAGRPDTGRPRVLGTRRFVRHGRTWLSVRLLPGASPATWRLSSGSRVAAVAAGRVAANGRSVTLRIKLPAHIQNRRLTLNVATPNGNVSATV